MQRMNRLAFSPEMSMCLLRNRRWGFVMGVFQLEVVPVDIEPVADTEDDIGKGGGDSGGD